MNVISIGCFISRRDRTENPAPPAIKIANKMENMKSRL